MQAFLKIYFHISNHGLFPAFILRGNQFFGKLTHTRRQILPYTFGTSLKLVFISNYIIDKTICIKYFQLTNHDP